MTNAAWEKTTPDASVLESNPKSRLKFLVAGVLLLGAVAYLMLSGMMSGTRYFITIDDLVNDPAYVGQTVRVSGAVIGDTIVYDDKNLIIDFEVAHIPEETDDLALTLYQAVNDPNATRMAVHIENEVKPDLLTNEAQAILTGEMGPDGVFYATELLLKCPSRYDEALPEQVAAG